MGVTVGYNRSTAATTKKERRLLLLLIVWLSFDAGLVLLVARYCVEIEIEQGQTETEANFGSTSDRQVDGRRKEQHVDRADHTGHDQPQRQQETETPAPHLMLSRFREHACEAR